MIKTLKLNNKLWLRHFMVLVVLCVPVLTRAQEPAKPAQKTPASLNGKYEGTAKGPNGDVLVTLDLSDDAGKFSGGATTPRGAYKITRGQMVDGLLSLELDANGSVAKLSLKQTDDKLVGELTADGKTGPVELKRVVKDDLSGVWEAAADAQGQAFPFTLTLKVEGEKVTGGSSSQLGESTISSGVWKDGKLAVVLEGGSGQVALIATVVDGKLVGDYDFAGQLQGKWVAAKKKP
jgi:hypothetical protein